MSKSRINRGRSRSVELQKQAEILVEDRASRSQKQQLALLDSRLGTGCGAVKERKLLHKMIEKLKAKKRSKK